MSFMPGDLHLAKSADGHYCVTMAGQEVLKTKSQKVAVRKFNQLRQEMEARFPARDLTPEEKKGLLERAIGDSLVGHNSLGGRKNWKSTAGSTRTFG